VEVKLQFPRTIPGALFDFVSAYHAGTNASPKKRPGYRVVGLEGTPSESGMIFPWQL
jgi:hypothetical protein